MRKFASRRGDAARVIRRVTIWNFYGVSAFNQKQKKKKERKKQAEKKSIDGRRTSLRTR